ncbi:uncharacterized protein LOC142364101 isoform X2 [Opisthocomus hoazin]|uniref:uncharacterized protein LOC142364101 isoform X2 n=1 Tax=Opisthocomus hoazin TaxID=30419 RepID=UPI003F533AE1
MSAGIIDGRGRPRSVGTGSAFPPRRFHYLHERQPGPETPRRPAQWRILFPINHSWPRRGKGFLGGLLAREGGGFSSLPGVKEALPGRVGGAGDGRCRDPDPGVPMGVLSCVKYLMFVFNVLVFAGGTCLAGVGVWVAVDPAGFQDIVAAKPVLSAGAYLLLAVGIALSLLGFLGCCGALRRSRPLLLGFFILVSLVFVAQLAGAVLFLVHWKQIQPELFLAELRRNYRGDEGAEVFSTAWNTLMVTDLKTLGTGPASRSCTRGRPGRRRAVPGPGSCRQASCGAGSSAGRGAPATSMSRAASPPSAGPCSSTSLSPGPAAWPCWASRSSPCSSPFAFITTSTEQGEARRRAAEGCGSSSSALRHNGTQQVALEELKAQSPKR